MATSGSDDFDSADEELSGRSRSSGGNNIIFFEGGSRKTSTIGSDSDGDVDYIPPVQQKKYTHFRYKSNETKIDKINEDNQLQSQMDKLSAKTGSDDGTPTSSTDGNKPKSRKQQSLGAKKLGVKQSGIKKSVAIAEKSKKSENQNDEEAHQDPLKQEMEVPESKQQDNTKKINSVNEDLIVPEELNSNLKFKDVFKPDGWEGLNDDIDLPDDFSDEKYQPKLDKLNDNTEKSIQVVEEENYVDSWSAWGSWGVTSLINTASVGVSAVTSHVSRGLSLLEETVGAPDPEEWALEDKRPTPEEEQSEEVENDSKSQLSVFGFGDLLSSVSSITKMVETTGAKVISGGLDGLETLGKKTMEILQDGDPGLKKKRAFLFQDEDKPILSQILREAKEKAKVESQTVEEQELARKIHFESIFDDFQGLVHLEALEMLSKQCNMKIQQHLINLDGEDLSSLQETLEEIKDLCDIGDEDEEDEEEESETDDEESKSDAKKTKDFETKISRACQDLGISLSFEKLINAWKTIQSSVPTSESSDISHQEIHQKAISAIAQFSAFSVERYHKCAELLLIKERRSTVNETDSLVQLTKCLSLQVGKIANLFCSRLNECKEGSDKLTINTIVTSTFMEATNASSYIQEAFRLLIPILQIGAI